MMPYSRPKLSDLYTLSQSKLLENHTLHSGTYLYGPYTAISRKVVRKSPRNNHERYCGWFWIHCSSKKFERMVWEAMDVRLWMQKENNKGRFYGYSVRNSVLMISHVTFWKWPVYIFYNNPSRNSCMAVPPPPPSWGTWIKTLKSSASFSSF